MNVHTKISDYLVAQPERKRSDIQALHDLILDAKLTHDRGVCGLDPIGHVADAPIRRIFSRRLLIGDWPDE